MNHQQPDANRKKTKSLQVYRAHIGSKIKIKIGKKKKRSTEKVSS